MVLQIQNGTCYYMLSDKVRIIMENCIVDTLITIKPLHKLSSNSRQLNMCSSGIVVRGSLYSAISLYIAMTTEKLKIKLLL